MHIIDRRNEALGGQANDRKIEDIANIGLHYTGVLGFITGHERFWKAVRKWSRGGYTFYIDRKGNIYQNYDYTRITWGASGWNHNTVHVSVEARNKHDYTDEQLKALDFVIHKILKECPNSSADRIHGHWEMTNTTACPGWNRSELDAIRAEIKAGVSLVQTPKEDPETLLKTLDALAREVINGVWGNGAERMRALNTAGYNAQEVQQRVNDLLKLGTKEELKPLNVIAREVLDGKWGNGQERRDKLQKAGYDPSDVQQRVNELVAPPKPKLKSLDVIAREVIEGKWGTGQSRFDKLNKAGYSAQQVQGEVNQILEGRKQKTKSIEVLAQEVIEGKHGSGDARRKSLEALYSPVQNLVNQMLRATPKKTIDQMAKEVLDGKHGNGHNNRRSSLNISQAEYDKVRRRVNQLA